MKFQSNSYLTSSYDYRENAVHLWEVDSSGEVIYSKHDFVPYVFIDIPDNNYKIDSNFSNLKNEKVIKKTFPTYNDYKSYVDRHKELDSPIQIYENNFSPRELQFIVERYKHIPIEKRLVTLPRIHIFDIETDSSQGFPKAEEAKMEVLSIAIYDSFDKKYYVYGTKNYDLNSLVRRLKKNKNYENVKNLISNIVYFLCEDEEDLLVSALNKMKKAWIYSGWNIENYDIPYLYNRCINIRSYAPRALQALNKISPIGQVKSILSSKGFQKKGIGKSYYRNYIGGKLIIDYMSFYKKFSYKRQSSFALDYVSNDEFGIGKIKLYDENEKQISLDQMHKIRFEEFILYNARDCEMIKLLDDKYNIFEFALMISTQCNIPAEKVINMSNIVDGSLLFYLRQTNQVAPGLPYNHSESYPGAYVKESQIGLFDWVVDFDITSSYPSHQICLNISTESLLGQVMIKKTKKLINDPLELRKILYSLASDEILVLMKNDKINQITVKDLKNLFEKKAISVAGDGRIYNQLHEGIMPRFLKKAFNWRMSLKKKMVAADNQISKTKDKTKIKELKIKKKKFSSQQLFAKMIINSVYGQTANRFSRFYSIGAATSITTSGVKTIKASDKILNQFFKENYALSNPWFSLLWKNLKKYKLWNKKEFTEKLLEIKEKTKNLDYVLFVDTDSNGYYLGPVLDILIENKLSDSDKIEFLLDMCKVISKYLNDRIKIEIKEIYYNSNYDDFEINFKQEIIAKKALLVGKKKYGLWVVNKDGVPQDKTSITGIEIIKSDTPKALREPLKDILNIVLKTHDPDEAVKLIKNKINKIKSKIRNEKNINLMDYAKAYNVNKLKEYSPKERKMFGLQKKCPIHIRSVLHHNDLIEKLNLTNKYFLIGEGEKIFFIPVIPKTIEFKKFNITSIAFKDDFPEEFFKYFEINFKEIIDKLFIEKVRIILNPTKYCHCLSDEQYLIKKLFN